MNRIVFLLSCLCFFSLLACAEDIKIFQSNRSLQIIESLTKLGPRVSGSASHDQATEFLFKTLSDDGLSVTLQKFRQMTPNGVVEFKNIVAKISSNNGIDGLTKLDGQNKKILILSTHYDTKDISPRVMLGANDGGSGVGVLVELAREIAQQKINLKNLNNFKVWFVFFDGEEAVRSYTATDGLYGSRYFARLLTPEQISNIIGVVNIDMIGDQNLTLVRDEMNDPALVDLFEQSSKKVGVQGRQNIQKSLFTGMPLRVLDDHSPFVDLHIPTLLLIDFEYGPNNIYWHTSSDTLDKLSLASLGMIGQSLRQMIETMGKK